MPPYFTYCLTILCLVPGMAKLNALTLPKLISNNMVLQRDFEIPIWGWAQAGKDITVEFNQKTYRTAVNSDGKWEIKMPPQPAGGPYSMRICTANDTLELSNILVGDVWVCSGQSNMELPMRRVSPRYPDEIKTANYPNIRYFHVAQKYDFNTTQEDVAGGNWIQVSPEAIAEISAVAYFFGKAIRQSKNIPIGMINSSLGGSPAEAWLSEEALRSFPEAYHELQKFKDQALVDSIIQSDRQRMNEWYHNSTLTDLGQQQGWKKPSFVTNDWQTMEVPGYWNKEDIGDINGVVWFRKDVDLPAEFTKSEAMIILGCIVDADSVFINGNFVGSTAYKYPPRRYKIPAGILKEGKNSIVIRVINNRGNGGFVEDKAYEITTATDTFDLQGKWQYKLGCKMEALKPETFIRWKPGGLYNGMLAPLTRFPIKGVIWYQGESNTANPAAYGALFSNLITSWRKQWRIGNFPFLYVQLANYMEASETPTESNWALLREMQRKTLQLPHTGMAVTIDIGEANDIHPLNKKDVGQRLALAAEKVAYGNKNIVFSGPTLTSTKIKKHKIVLTFENIGTGIMLKNGNEVKELAIAGEDKKFVWARSKIKGNQIIVWSDEITKPLAVRYAWSDNPAKANLYNQKGLPASPFRTDDW